MAEKTFDETKMFKVNNDEQNEAKRVLLTVYSSLKEKGYNPVNQIVGYLISGDPVYITSYNNARNVIRDLERDDLVEELVNFYLRHNTNK